MKRHRSRFRMTEDKSGVSFVDASDEALIVPVRSDGDIILIIEPSAAFDENVLLLPGGSIEPDEDAAVAAHRELQEEVGVKAARLDFLGEIRPWSKYLHMCSHIYLARDLSETQAHGDEPYVIQRVTISLERAQELIAEGTLRDARVIVALQMTQARLSAESA